MGAGPQGRSLQGTPELAAKEKPQALRRPLPALAPLPHRPPPGDACSEFQASSEHASQVAREPGLSLPNAKAPQGGGPDHRHVLQSPGDSGGAQQGWPPASGINAACRPGLPAEGSGGRARRVLGSCVHVRGFLTVMLDCGLMSTP